MVVTCVSEEPAASIFTVVTLVTTSQIMKGKVKLSLYRPWRLLGLQKAEAPIFSDIRLMDDGEVVSPTRRPLFTPKKILDNSFLLEAELTPGP
jgi:hypothetical protein